MEVAAYRSFYLDKKGSLFSPVASLLESTPRFKIGEVNKFESQTETYIGFHSFACKTTALLWNQKFPRPTILLPVKIADLSRIYLDNSNQIVIVTQQLSIDQVDYQQALAEFDSEYPGYLELKYEPKAFSRQTYRTYDAAAAI